MIRIAPIVVLLAGCMDGFFVISGRVTRCADDQPLVGVKVELILKSGVSADETSVAYSDPDGTFSVALDEPPSASARLVLEKPGYAGQEQDYSQASTSQVFCMTP